MRFQLGSSPRRSAPIGCKRLLLEHSIRTSRLLVWSCGRLAAAWQRRFLELIGYCASQWEAALCSGGRRVLAVAGTQRKHPSARSEAEAALLGKTRLQPRPETHPARGGLKSARMVSSSEAGAGIGDLQTACVYTV